MFLPGALGSKANWVDESSNDTDRTHLYLRGLESIRLHLSLLVHTTVLPLISKVKSGVEG